MCNTAAANIVLDPVVLWEQLSYISQTTGSGHMFILCVRVFLCYLQYIGEAVLILFSLHFPAVNEDLTQQCTTVSNPP